MQWSTTLRNAWLDQIETTLGTTPSLFFFTGSPPANCATADSGTEIIEIVLPSDWMGAAASGLKAKSGTWSGTAAATGTIGYARLKTSGGTCHWQGTVTAALTLATSAATLANSNILTFTATTGITVGQDIGGTGIQELTTVLAVDATTVTMSKPTLTGVLSGASLLFGDVDGDLVLNTTVIGSVGQAITVDSFTLGAPGS